MSLLSGLFGSSDPEVRAVKGARYIVANADIFNKVVFLSGNVTAGETLIAEGPGGGGHPAFRRTAGVPANAPEGTKEIISTSFRAKGKPAGYGLSPVREM
jgi:hypothetical protein